MNRCFELGWTERMKRNPVVVVTASGKRGFLDTFGIEVSEESGNAIKEPFGEKGSQSPRSSAFTIRSGSTILIRRRRSRL